MLQKFDERNKDIKVFIKDKLVHRDEARISVFDSVVQGGDAVWEGLRVYKDGIFLFEKHLDRLFNSAHALAFNNLPTRTQIKKAVFETLVANKMYDDTHIRLTLTRGEKITSGMDPRLNQQGCSLIVLAEFKSPVYDKKGIKIISSSVRRNSPQFLDSKIHHNNLLNNIQAKIQANVSGKDDALMLDEHGFASELNGTNIFMIKDQVIYTPHADSCLPGITREFIIKICEELNLKLKEKNISLSELYISDGVFTSGTMGEIVPVIEIDGRKIKENQSIFSTISNAFDSKKYSLCVPVAV